MFDPWTADLIRSAPAVEGIDVGNLPQELTEIYAELVSLRLQANAPDAEVARAQRLDRLLRVAAIYEALADVAVETLDRRAAAFVAATAYQIVGRLTRREPALGQRLLTPSSIHPLIAAPLLFLVAGQSPDAREAGRRLPGLDPGDLLLTALLESVADLSAERLHSILERGRRLQGLRSSRDLPLSTRAAQALYGLCWSGLVQLSANLLREPQPVTAFQSFDQPQEAFRRVEDLSASLLQLPGEGAVVVAAFSGPRHLARLLKGVAEQFEGNGLTSLSPPPGAQSAFWNGWVRERAKTKPMIWPNHKPAIDAGLLRAGQSAVLVLPTGAGKTTLSELKIAATLSMDKKAIFVAPTLALVDQLRDELAGVFPNTLGAISVSADGDLNVLTSSPELSNIEVMTPERLLAMLSFPDTDLTDVGLIVFDECHILSPVGGGRRSLDAMMSLIHALRRAPDADILLLSAMISNGQELADWLTDIGRPAIYCTDPWKPSRQARGVVVYPAKALQILRNYAAAKSQKRKIPPPSKKLVPYALFGLRHNWVRTNPKDTSLTQLLQSPVTLGLGKWGPTPNANQVAAQIATNAARAGLKSIIFVQQADHAVSTASAIAPALSGVTALVATEQRLWDEVQVELGAGAKSIVDVHAGALPHNGDMLPQERRLAEALYRRADGPGVIVATPTLAQGMNLPAQLAVLAGDVRAADQQRVLLQQHELLNAAGRAGRAGHLANGTVLLIPEPVVGFAGGSASPEAFDKLQSILPPNDQCLTVDDPQEDLLDRIQSGAGDAPQVQYFLSRIRSAEADGSTDDGALSNMKRTLAAFRAKRNNETLQFELRLNALRDALDTEAQHDSALTMQVAGFTGLPKRALDGIKLQMSEEISSLPSDIPAWCDWMVSHLARNPAAVAELLGDDAATLTAVARGKKAGGEMTAPEFERIRAGLRAWVSGKPFCVIEAELGVPPAEVGTCKRARDLALKLASRRLYLLAAAVSDLAKGVLAESGHAPKYPAVLEILSSAVRRGIDSPEKLAFALRATHIRTRVGMHKAFEEQLGSMPPAEGASFSEVLALIDVRLAFRGSV